MMAEAPDDATSDGGPQVERYWILSLLFISASIALMIASTRVSELRSRLYCYSAAVAAAMGSLTCVTSWWKWTRSNRRPNDTEIIRFRTELEHLQRLVAAQGSSAPSDAPAYLAMGSAPPWVPPGLPTPHHGLDGPSDPAGTPLGAFCQFAQGVDPGGPLFGVSTPGMALPPMGLSPPRYQPKW